MCAVPSDEMSWKLNEIGSRLAEIDQRHMAEHKRQEIEINHLKERLSYLADDNKNLRNALKRIELCGELENDPLNRRVEWNIDGISEKLNSCPKNMSLWSPEFSVCGLRGMQLEFFPNGRESATLDGFCSVFFWCPEGTSIKYQLFVGSHYRAPDEDVYEARMGHGHSNFCLLEAEIIKDRDSVTVGVDILDVVRETEIGGQLKVIRSSITDIVRKEIAVFENRDVASVEWQISGISKRLKQSPRGASIYSPIFSAAGIRDMLLEFYPNGNANTQKDGFCSLYLRCPEGTQIIVTLAVGDYRKGPIMAKFDGPAGKGLPEFCELSDHIDTVSDTLVVSLEVKNQTAGMDGGKKACLKLG